MLDTNLMYLLIGTFEAEIARAGSRGEPVRDLEGALEILVIRYDEVHEPHPLCLGRG